MQQITAVLFSGGLDSAVLLALRGAGRTGPADLRHGRAGVGSGRSARSSARFSSALAARPANVQPLASLRFDMTRRLSAVALGRPRRGASVRHAGRGRLPRRPQHHAAVQGGRLHGRAPSIERVCIGPLAGNPFPDATPSSSTTFAQRAVDRPRAPDRDRGAVRRTAQGGRDPPGSELGVPLELTLSCMQPRRGPALRTLQQVPRARDAFIEGGRRGSDDVCGERRSVGGSQEARRRIEPSPVRIFRSLPPSPSRPRTARRLVSSRSCAPGAGVFVRFRLRCDLELVADAAVAGACVELGAKVRRQIQRHAAVAGRKCPSRPS